MKKRPDHHFVVKFQIRAVIGPADLKFELCEWHLRVVGMTVCSADSAIRAQWEKD